MKDSRRPRARWPRRFVQRKLVQQIFSIGSTCKRSSRRRAHAGGWQKQTAKHNTIFGSLYDLGNRGPAETSPNSGGGKARCKGTVGAGRELLAEVSLLGRWSSQEVLQLVCSRRSPPLP